MNLRGWMYAASLFVVIHTAWTEPVYVQQELRTDYETGKITKAEYIAYQLQALKGGKQLPEKYREYDINVTRKGTLLSAKAKALMDVSTGREKQLLQKTLARPAFLDHSLQSPSDFSVFIILRQDRILQM